MADKPQQINDSDKPGSSGQVGHDKEQGLAEKSVTEHHVEGAEGPIGAEAEEDNNP